MLKIFIADDHALIREGFKKLIDREMGMQVVGEAKDSMEVLSKLRDTACDVLVLDLSMPGKNGLELLKDLREITPDLKILILTMHPEERYAIRCLRAGASGYLTKGGAPKELIKAIRRVVEGRKYISETLAEHLAVELDTNRTTLDHEKLSDREYEVFALLVDGKSTAEIAEKLNISSSTVNTYRMRIFEKMGTSSVAELVQYAIRNNLID